MAQQAAFSEHAMDLAIARLREGTAESGHPVYHREEGVHWHTCGREGEALATCRQHACTSGELVAMLEPTVEVKKSRMGRGIGLFVHTEWIEKVLGGAQDTLVVATGGVAAVRSEGGYHPCHEGCDLVWCARAAMPDSMLQPYGIDAVYARGGVVSTGRICAVPGTDMPRIVLERERFERFRALRMGMGMPVPETIEVVVDWGEGFLDPERKTFVGMVDGAPLPVAQEPLRDGIAAMPVSSRDGRVKDVPMPIGLLEGWNNTVLWATSRIAGGMRHIRGWGHTIDEVAGAMEARGRAWEALVYSKEGGFRVVRPGERANGCTLQVLLAGEKRGREACNKTSTAEVNIRRAKNRARIRRNTDKESEHQAGWQKWAEAAICSLGGRFTAADVVSRAKEMFPGVVEKLRGHRLRYSRFVERGKQATEEEALGEFRRNICMFVTRLCGHSDSTGMYCADRAEVARGEKEAARTRRMAKIRAGGEEWLAIDVVVQGMRMIGCCGTAAQITEAAREWQPRLGDCRAAVRNQLNNLIARRSSVFTAKRTGKTNVYNMAAGEGAEAVLRELGCTVV